MEQCQPGYPRRAEIQGFLVHSSINQIQGRTIRETHKERMGTTMSSVQDQIECRQCGYQEADYIYHCRVGEDTTTCRLHESWTVKRDQAGTRCGWTHEIDEGFGALWYSRTGRSEFAGHFLHSAQELADAETWLRERLAKGEVDPHASYLTHWNKETKQVELVIGEFYEWPNGQ